MRASVLSALISKFEGPSREEREREAEILRNTFPFQLGAPQRKSTVVFTAKVKVYSSPSKIRLHLLCLASSLRWKTQLVSHTSSASLPSAPAHILWGRVGFFDASFCDGQTEKVARKGVC